MSSLAAQGDADARRYLNYMDAERQHFEQGVSVSQTLSCLAVDRESDDDRAQ
jgi:hypothetical protein